MIQKTYLVMKLGVVNDYYKTPKVSDLRVVKTEPTLKQNEIGFTLNIDIPDILFKRIAPLVSIELPADVFVSPDADVAVTITAKQVAEALKLDVEEVKDGLAEMVRKANEDEE